MGAALPPMIPIAWLRRTMPSPATLNTPSWPWSVARTTASAASSSWSSCRRGSKPAKVGTMGSDRYCPRVVPSPTRYPIRRMQTLQPGVRSENSCVSCSISTRSRLSPYTWRSDPAISSVTNDGSAGDPPYKAWLDFTTSRLTGLDGPAQPVRTFIVPITLVSCAVLSSPCESTLTAMWTTVSMCSWRTSLPITACLVSACTKSIASTALSGSATSHPNSIGTFAESRRATSAPSGFETPVMRTRRGVCETRAGGVTPRLWIYAPNHRRVGYPLHGDRVRGQTHVDALVHRGMKDVVERARDDVVQLRVDLLLLPEESLEVLHPLEVGNDHAACVGDDVWDQEYAAVVEDGIGVGRHRCVGTFGDQARPDPRSVVRRDDVLSRRRHQHCHRQLEELRVGDVVRFLEARDAAADLLVLVECGEVEPVRVVDAALRVAYRDDLEAGFRQEAGSRAADLAVTLHGNGRRLVLDVEVFDGFERQVGGASPGRVDATLRAANVDWFARHRGRN